MPAPTVTDELDDLHDLGELPPLDGDARDAPEPEVEPGEGIDPDGDASLDDATGEDDPADTEELDLDEREQGWLQEPADAPDLDVGDVAITDFGGETSGLDDGDEAAGAGGGGEEDLGLGNAPERGGLDGGDEGPLGRDEELREADLPPLDADEEGDLEDASLVDAGFGADEPAGLPWAAEPWSRVGAPVALASATAVACAGRGALVAGREEGGAAELVRVNLEGTTQSLPTEGLDPGSVKALAVEGDVVAALVERGAVMLSNDGGATFAPVGDGLSATDLALVGGALWLRVPAGGIAVLRGAEVDLAPVGTGPFAAMARDAAGGVAALVADEAGAASGLVRARGTNDGAVEQERLAAPEACGPRAVLAVRGVHVAYALPRGGVARRGADGAWVTHAWDGRVTALAFVDDAGTLVAATYTDADDTTALVRVEAEGVAAGAPRASVVGRTGSGGAVLEMACDDARGVVWVVGGFGVAAFAVS